MAKKLHWTQLIKLKVKSLEEEIENLKSNTGKPVDFSELKALVKKNGTPLIGQHIQSHWTTHPVTRKARSTRFDMENFGNVRCLSIDCVDDDYIVVTEEIIKEIAMKVRVDKKKYVSNFMDCDDYAELFRIQCRELGLNSCGFALSRSGSHSFNIFPVKDEEYVNYGGYNFLIFEPQANPLRENPFKEPGGPYDFKDILVIF